MKREKLTVAANNRYVCKYLKSSVRYYRYFFVVHVVVAGYFYYIVYGITDGSTGGPFSFSCNGHNSMFAMWY